jgi:hypothetical protein
VGWALISAYGASGVESAVWIQVHSNAWGPTL